MVEFYLLTFPRFPLRKPENTNFGFHKNRTHDFRTSIGVLYMVTLPTIKTPLGRLECMISVAAWAKEMHDHRKKGLSPFCGSAKLA